MIPQSELAKLRDRERFICRQYDAKERAFKRMHGVDIWDLCRGQDRTNHRLSECQRSFSEVKA